MQINWKLSLMAVAIVTLTACGGGDDDDNDNTAPPTTPPTSGGMYDVTKVDGRRFTKQTEVSNVKAVAVLVTAPANTVRLGALPAEETFIDYSAGKAVRVAAGRDLPETATAAQTRQALNWSRNASGQAVGAIEFQADGALGLRLGLLVDALPNAAVIRLSSQASGNTVYEALGAEVNASVANNAAAGDTSAAGRTWWTPNLGSNQVTLEITLPAGADAASLGVAIPSLSHTFVDVTSLDAAAKGVGDSGACELDVTCTQDGANQRDAVARMLYQSGSSGYYCTGTLLNDAAQSNLPYFLSANHCISTQAEASSMQTDWFFRTATCNSGQLSASSTKRYNGAKLLWSQTINDMTLMQLNDQPPAGAWMAGWDAGLNNQSQAVYDVHQPMGDYAKIAYGNVVSFGQCAFGNGGLSCGASNDGNSRFYRVEWSRGTTEGGSSGSGLLTSGGYVIGTLTGGSASCSNQAGADFFGRLDYGFSNGMNRWLVAKDPTKL